MGHNKNRTKQQEQRHAIEISLLQHGYGEQGAIDVCILDLKLPELNGLEILRQSQGRTVPVLVLTGQGSVEDAVASMQLGAQHFIQKPVESHYLWELLMQLMQEGRKPAQETWVSESHAAQEFFRSLQQASQVREPVLLIGETGVGKKLAARLLHELTHRYDSAFHIFRATGLDGREASERLFGDTDDASKPYGDYYKAFGGSLFIEEIGELPLKTQGQLLNVLERADQSRSEVTDEAFTPPRLILSTRYDLMKRVEDGSFRPDLFYRLGVLPLVVPPLRKREADILQITKGWLQRLAMPGQLPRELSAGAERAFLNYSYPGNIRELINIVKRLVVFSSHGEISEIDVLRALDWSPFQMGQGASPGVGALGVLGDAVPLAEVEKKHTELLLGKHKNISEVARILKIDRRTLQRKIQSWQSEGS